MPDLDRRGFLVRTAGTAAGFALIPDLEALGRARKTQETLRLGLIGVGRHGRAILSELAKIEQADVVALCDPNERRLRSGLRRAREAKTYANHAELLDKQSDLDAVIVATPTHLHRQPAVDALQAGKHVFCEAPMASNMEDCRALAAAARSAKTVFQVGYQSRCNPVYDLARSFVRSGVLREVVSLRAHWNNKTSWQFGTEPASNWRLDPEISLGLPGEVNSHQVDAIGWFLDQWPESVRGIGDIRLHQDGRKVADSVQLELRYPGGVRLQVESSLCSSFEGRYELFRGSNATVKMAETFGWLFKEADSATQGWEVYASREHFHNDEGITLIADATSLAKQGKLKDGIGLPHPPLHYALKEFMISALEGMPVKVSAADGLRATVVGIQAQAAVTSGKEIELTEELYQAG